MVLVRRNRTAFTLLELLVTIGIIAVLISILVPVVSRVRRAAHVADTQSFITQLDGAIQRYYSEFHAYPGPIPNDECGYNPTNNADFVYLAIKPGVVLNKNMTGAENLALGLLGGLYWNPATTHFEVDIQRMLSGKGPSTLKQAGLPKTFDKFIEAKNLFTSADVTDSTLTTGYYHDEAGWALNTEIPEFLDRFPSPMPILYMRANVGAPPPTGPITNTNNPIITPQRTPAAQYDLKQIIGYTSNLGPQGRYIGEGKLITGSKYKGGTIPPAHGLNTVDPTASMEKSDAKYVYPYDAYPYFTTPNSPNTARQKDGYILISAGPDRIYGTEDDICNFGSVLP